MLDVLGGDVPMSVDLMVLALWDDEELLRQFENRQKLLNAMVGTLYPSILYDENEVIGQEAIRRTTYHPNFWREKGIVHTSWTDDSGLVHNPYFLQCPAVYNTPWIRGIDGRRDEPAKEFTCLWCLASGSGLTS